MEWLEFLEDVSDDDSTSCMTVRCHVRRLTREPYAAFILIYLVYDIHSYMQNLMSVSVFVKPFAGCEQNYCNFYLCL